MSPADKISAAFLTLTGFLVVLLTSLLWGGSIPTIKVSEYGLPPLFMATGRITIATLLLWMYGRLIREPVMIPREQGLSSHKSPPYSSRVLKVKNRNISRDVH